MDGFANGVRRLGLGVFLAVCLLPVAACTMNMDTTGFEPGGRERAAFGILIFAGVVWLLFRGIA